MNNNVGQPYLDTVLINKIIAIPFFFNCETGHTSPAS